MKAIVLLGLFAALNAFGASSIVGPWVNIQNSPSVSISPLPTTSPIPVFQAPASSASTAQSTTIGSSAAVSFSAPSGAIKALVQSSSSNTVNVRCMQGGTATTTTGTRLEPGRSEVFESSAALSCISESSTNQEVDVQWFAK